MRFIFSILFVVYASLGVAQRPHLEVGFTLGYKAEVFNQQQFKSNTDYTLFNLFNVKSFVRISKLKLGGQLGIGFEKASDYYIRYNDNTAVNNYFNLNRITVEIAPYYYLIKNSKFKWDIQLGVNGAFNLQNNIKIPETHAVKTSQISVRLGSNITVKNYFLGLFYESHLSSDYYNTKQPIAFGYNVGFIF